MNKQVQYEALLKQAVALMATETDAVANMANLCALLKDTFGWFWIGFYRVDRAANELILGPFQGPLACTRIAYGRGVCGEVWASGKAQIVPNVHAHPNHIACSSLSQSEIVIPLTDATGRVFAVLDIDSEQLDTFDEVDAKYLSLLVDDFHSLT